jgi:phage-related minor tail protein
MFGGARATGGPVASGKAYLVGERGPELFMPGASGTIIPNDFGGGGSVNVTVNIDASGTKIQGDNAQAEAVARMVGDLVRGELVRQKRPGGALA